ncbi:hypothetical protein F7725_020020 [Dissostichus mawsoni]|uniref:PPC domain-containing protein n=1 Tax=Dissostichus mawsoni TaxID=36200 RepID=A0A7J5YMX8_DISMA|nr:hypothetical protein F7725_020020 [Dissostichus mawsoni]
MSSLQAFSLRLGPGQELLGALKDFVDQNRLQAPFIITCVGSVTKATLRLANATATNTDELSGRYEIVSLVGTLNPEAHLHICLSDAEGVTVGGHVLGGLEVFTTAELVLGERGAGLQPGDGREDGLPRTGGEAEDDGE